MGKNQVRVDNDQARILARAIYRDIAAYIESHQEEYHTFLQEERMHQNEKNQDTRRSSSAN